MSRFSENIKLLFFQIARKAYKKKLFSDVKENTELNLVAYLLQKHPLFFIDVGANRGEFIFTAEKILPSTKIWAFEPLPYFAKKLQALFPKVHVFDIALSDSETETTLYLPVLSGIPDDSLSSVNKPTDANFISYNVKCNTLDNIVKQQKLTEKLFLKIDVEGHEFSVLKGAETTLKENISVMLIEIEERHHTWKKLFEMTNEIEQKGFVCYYLHPEKAQLVRFLEDSPVFQNKTDLNTKNYINNFWFFAKHFPYENVITELNNSIH